MNMKKKPEIKVEVKTYEKIGARAVPKNQIGVINWIRENLLSSKSAVLLSILALFFLYGFLPPLFAWLFTDATWVGDAQQMCDREGACWIFIKAKFYQFMYGFYPANVVWRVNLVFFLYPILVLPFFIKRIPIRFKLYFFVFAFIVYPILGYMVISGFSGTPCIRGAEQGLCYVPTHKWGGLMVTLIMTYVGILGSFPIGVIVGLGRASKLKLVHYLSVAYVEFWRGVPLITILFTASVVLPFFLPPGVEFDKLIRAIVGIILFQSAYVAEVLRGGLQAIPRGQYEAADALGLSYVKKMGYIILPQALKIVLPSFVGISISLMQDTTLILILGLFDVLGMVGATIADPNWLGFEEEGYAFVAILAWTICYGMSRYSVYLEKKTSTDRKN